MLWLKFLLEMYLIGIKKYGIMKLSSIGERGIIDEIWRVIGENLEYDDCAVIDGDNFLLITTDFIGEGTHFMSDWDFFYVGKFLASINLSDIAAMGGVPEFFLASMFFPGNFEFENVKKIINGMMSVLNKYNVKYLGGDLKESGIAGMSGIAVGHVEKDKILRRKGAKIGDRIYITGMLGKQAAGYYLWKNGYEDGWKHLLDVKPRIDEGRKIAGRATSCMDISDGLMHTVQQMEKINSLGFRIDFESLPVHPLAYEVSEDFKIPLETLVLYFGGEYELFFTASSSSLGKEIGLVDKMGGIWREGKRIEGEGYAHFSKALEKIRGQ